MNAKRQRYNHRSHAGNAGDVWKHFILAEASDHLLHQRKRLLYAESHVGYPEYSLEGTGEWMGGIGKCWPRLPDLLNFCYFRVIKDLNPQYLTCYPGSARLVLEMAQKHRQDIDLEIWDIDPHVAIAWNSDPRVNFHLGDGFEGIEDLLDRSPPGMLLIDPPYLDKGDAKRACCLLDEAEKAKWIVLWWQMMGAKTLPKANFRIYSLNFNDAGLDCGRWPGAVMAVAGTDESLVERLDRSVQMFMRIMRSERRF